MYVSQCAKLDESAPRIPEILHFFSRDDTLMAYAVMDYIKPACAPVPDLPQRVALALQWLRDLPPPQGHVGIGPLGDDCANHMLFKNYTAPFQFSSIQALERYLNRVGPRLYLPDLLPSANIRRELDLNVLSVRRASSTRQHQPRKAGLHTVRSGHK